MPIFGQAQTPETKTKDEPEIQLSPAEQAKEMAEIRLSQTLDELEIQVEYHTYTRLYEQLEGSKIDYENAWNAFLHTNEGRHYNDSNHRHQHAKDHYRRTLEKVASTGHYQNYTAIENHRVVSTQMVAAAEEKLAVDPDYSQTEEYRQINRSHQNILDQCRRAWKDIGYTHEGKDYQRAKVQADRTEREVSLAWARAGEIPQGQKLALILDQIAQLEQACQQAEEAYKQTPAYDEYVKAGENYRRAALVADQNSKTETKRPKIILIEDNNDPVTTEPPQEELAAA